MALKLVNTPAAPDLGRFVQDLTEGVESGDVTGLGVVVMLKGRRFFVDVFGQMVRTPFESIGLVQELEHCLREIGRKRRNGSTTKA